MKKSLFILLQLVISLNVQAQKFSSSKENCLNAITQKGFTYAQQKDNPSIYWYLQYDEYGECMVQLTFDGNRLRQVVIGHHDSKSNLERFRNLFKTVSQQETLSFDWSPNGDGYGRAYNTKYFNGNANYKCDTRNYFFIIQPIY